MSKSSQSVGVSLLAMVFVLLGAATFAQSAAVAPTASAPSSEKILAPISLRGYGTVSGSYKKVGSGSVLQITCEDEAEAKLLQAKYLSDLNLLPGVKSEKGKEPMIYTVESQGAIVAYCSGNKVTILAAPDNAGLQSLIAAEKPTGVTTAQVEVPMYLDRWDKFGFRHYYRAWERPKGQTDGTYDVTTEFDYARDQDRAGILISAGPLSTDSAADILNTGWADWVGVEAAKRQLPVDIHLSAGAGSEPAWFVNKYIDQTQMKMPGFTGNFHELMTPYLGGGGVLSWSSTTGEDARLGLLQQAVKQTASQPNVVSYLEPHGELHHGAQDILLEYGPVADAGYRRYLQEKYGTVAAVAKRWGVPLKAWDDVHLPELASFAGWGPEAMDVGGLWRVGYEELTEPTKSAYGYERNGAPKSNPAPEEWFKADFDDSTWPEVPSGNDKELFLHKNPAVFRRTFDVSSAWKAKNPRTWLYLWDMNLASHQEVRVVLNGHEVGRGKITPNVPHWSAMEVTDSLQDGKNTLAIHLPQGVISYKVYLSPDEPKQYPDLGENLNAQWVDFTDFTQWSRVETVKRGMEMIRQAAPNQGITLMHPDEYSDGVKSMGVAYGGEFHNTGYMGGFYADYNPSLMRGAGLPYSLEPGGPAHDLADFKKQFGLWQVEGVQSVDYFIHLGDIFWNPEIKADYEAHRKQISLMGQNHFPKAEVALLYSDRIAQLTGYPWGIALSSLLPGGYWNWTVAPVLRGYYPYDGLSQSSFTSGDANAYKVIIDSNTSLMDEAMVSEIEKWVRAGGTFITLAQTGRHTPEKPDSWPISRLTGYQVTKIDELAKDGGIKETGTLQPAPDQTLFSGEWGGVVANGLHMTKVAKDALDLLLWNDGTVAAGMRPLGKGYIIDLGAKFAGAKMGDRIEPGGNSPERQQLRQLLSTLLDWRGIAHEPAHLDPENEFVILRHGVTNNGLYDTWTVWNQSKDQPQTVAIVMEKGKSVASAFESKDGKSIPVTASPDGDRLNNITLEPLETRVFLTPIGKLDQAPLAWFELQRDWWRGTTKPDDVKLPEPTSRFSLNLTQDWKFHTLDKDVDATPELAVAFDDKSWATRSLGIWDVKDEGGKGHGVFRKTFTVPAQWDKGLVSIWMTVWTAGRGNSFVESGRVWMDGVEVKPMNGDAYIAIGVPELKAGTTHTLAVEVQSSGVLAGLRGNSWLSFEPTAPQKIDLAGKWAPSADGLTYSSPIDLPGKFDAQFLKRTVPIDAKYKGQNIMITVDGSPNLVSVLINGKLVRHHHHMIGSRWSLNISPFVKFGAENEIEIIPWNDTKGGEVKEIFLGIFDPKYYP